MHRRQVLDYLSMAVIWGVSFILILKVSIAFGWVGAVTFRALIASAVLLVMALVTRRRLHFGRWWPLAVVGATTVAGQLIGLSVSTPLIGTAMVAIFVGTIPLFTMLIGHAWGIDQITRTGLIGLLMGFTGIVLLVGFPTVDIDGRFLLGCAVALFGAVCSAFGSNYARRHLQDIGSWEQTMGAFFIGGALMLPMLLVVPVPSTPAAVDYLYLIAVAAICSALAYVLFFRLVAEVGATIAISVEFLVTVIAVIIGAAFLGERLSVVQIIGGAVIIIGCTLVLGLLPRRPSHDG